MDCSKRLLPKNEKFRFFSTGTLELLMKGIEVELDMSFTPNELKNFLLNKIQKHVSIQKCDLIVYISGGIPFLSGNLKDIYCKEVGPQPSPYIYGVLTSPLNPIDISNNYYELCNTNDINRKTLLSPLFESTSIGLSNIACLLGYLNHEGNHSDLFLRSCAYFIHFPPLITSLQRVIDNYDVNGRDIITICSTLWTYFRWMVPNNIKSIQLFEYALKCCNLLCNDPNIPESLPLQTIEITPNISEDMKFLTKLNLGRYAYVWTGDFGLDYNSAMMKEIEMCDIEKAYEKNMFFTPILPLSILDATGCSIVRGKKHNFLYLKQSCEKGTNNVNNVDIIDPMTGFVDSIDVYSFAKREKNSLNTRQESFENVIDTEKIKQIILVYLDETSVMKNKFDFNDKSKDCPTCQLAAIQFLTAFANRLLGYRIPCMIGLASYKGEALMRVPFTPFTPDFEAEILKESKLGRYDIYSKFLSFAIDEIKKFSLNESGQEIYPKAVKRIILMGQFYYDNEGYLDYANITKELIKNKIIFDNVTIGDDDYSKLITAIAHISGGLSFNPKTIIEGLNLFENSAFLDFNVRYTKIVPVIPDDRYSSPKRIKQNPDIIEPNFLRRAAEKSSFDSDLMIYHLCPFINHGFATPRHIVFVNQGVQAPNKRIRRILRELRLAANLMNENSPDYDDEIKIFTLSIDMTKWTVFIKGTSGTIYEGRWYQLKAFFPDLYPAVAPAIYFSTAPYHLNISKEG